MTHLNGTIPNRHGNKRAVTCNQSTFMAAGSDWPWALQNQLQLISGWVIPHPVIVTRLAYYCHVISECELFLSYLSCPPTIRALPQLSELFLNYQSCSSASWAVPQLSQLFLNYHSCSSASRAVPQIAELFLSCVPLIYVWLPLRQNSFIYEGSESAPKGKLVYIPLLWAGRPSALIFSVIPRVFTLGGINVTEMKKLWSLRPAGCFVGISGQWY